MESKGLVRRRHEVFCDAVRCCQDLLKRREKVEALVEETVRRSHGLDPKQRSHWVKIAKRCNVEVVALRFTATASTCIERAKARAAKGEHDGELNNPDKVAGLIGIMKNRQKQCIISRLARHRRGLPHSTHWLRGQKPIGKGERFDQVLDASEDDDEKNVALVDALLGRTPSPSPAKRKAPAATEPDTRTWTRGLHASRSAPRRHFPVVDLTADDQPFLVPV